VELGLNHRVRASYKWTPDDMDGLVARCDTSALPEGRLLDVRVGKGRHYICRLAFRKMRADGSTQLPGNMQNGEGM
jgi:hypothetical protein